MGEFCQWCEYDEAYESDNGHLSNEFEKKVDDALATAGIHMAVERGRFEEYTCEKCDAVVRTYDMVVDGWEFIKKGKPELSTWDE